MERFTFRTECAADNERVPELMTTLGINDCAKRSISDPLVSDYTMGVFSFDSELSVDDLRAQMERLIEDDDRFADMHRCYQTLAEGDEPDEEWYMRPSA